MDLPLPIQDGLPGQEDLISSDPGRFSAKRNHVTH
jgi:hypothetical protein